MILEVYIKQAFVLGEDGIEQVNHEEEDLKGNILTIIVIHYPISLTHGRAHLTVVFVLNR